MPSYTPRGYYDPTSVPSRGVMGTVSAPFPTPALEQRQINKEREAAGDFLVEGVQGSTRRMTPQEYNLQSRMLSDQVDEFDSRMQMLNNVQQRMDPMGTTQLQEINKKHAGLQKAYRDGRINTLELFRGTAKLNEQLTMFNWNAHVKGKGAVPGDRWIDEEEGVVYHNVIGKGPVPMEYTPEGIKKRTWLDPETGTLHVPVAPGQAPKVYNREEHSGAQTEQARVEKIQREILRHTEALASANPMADPAELRAQAEKNITNSLDAARRIAAKIYGTEGSLTDAQKRRTIEEEMGQVGPLQDTVESSAVQTKRNIAAEKERTKTAKETQGKKVRGTRTAAGPNLAQALAQAGEDPDQIADARAEWWQEDPDIRQRAQNPIPVTEESARGSFQEGFVYRINNKALNRAQDVIYLNGKLWPLAEPKQAPAPSSQQMNVPAGRPLVAPPGRRM